MSWMPAESLNKWKSELVELSRQSAGASGRLQYQYPMMKIQIEK
jgi:hypothetical protein